MKRTTTSHLASVAALVAVVGVAVVPVVASAASQTANTTIDAVLGSSVSITTSGTVMLNITPVSGGKQSSASYTVTVNTNNVNGYKLAVKYIGATMTPTNGTNTIVRNNFFTTRYTYGHCTDNKAPGSTLTWTNNRWWENNAVISGC